MATTLHGLATTDHLALHFAEEGTRAFGAIG